MSILVTGSHGCIGPLPTRGTRQTIERFAALHEAGRLDTRELA